MIMQSRDARQRLPYPWSVWFENQRFTLVRGVDYSCHTYAMAQQVRNAARPKRCNVRVSIKIAADGESLTVVVSRPNRSARGSNIHVCGR